MPDISIDTYCYAKKFSKNRNNTEECGVFNYKYSQSLFISMLFQYEYLECYDLDVDTVKIYLSALYLSWVRHCFMCTLLGVKKSLTCS